MYATRKLDISPCAPLRNRVAELLPVLGGRVALRTQVAAHHRPVPRRASPLFLALVRAHGRDPGARQAHGAGVYRRPVRRRGHKPTPRGPATWRCAASSHWLAAEGEISEDRLIGMTPPKLNTKITDPLTDARAAHLIRVCQGTGFRRPPRRGHRAVDGRNRVPGRRMRFPGRRRRRHTARVGPIIRSVKAAGIEPCRFGPQTATVVDRYIRMRRTHKLGRQPELWLPTEGEPSGTPALYRALRRRAVLAGIDDFHPHVLRHTAATRWLAAGGSEGSLMSISRLAPTADVGPLHRCHRRRPSLPRSPPTPSSATCDPLSAKVGGNRADYRPLQPLRKLVGAKYYEDDNESRWIINTATIAPDRLCHCDPPPELPGADEIASELEEARSKSRHPARLGSRRTPVEKRVR